MKKDINLFVKEYEDYASKYIFYINHGKKEYEEDAKKLAKLNKLIRKDNDFGKKVIDLLIDSNDVSIKSCISIMALELNYNVEKALNNLNNIANDRAYGPFRAYIKLHLLKYKNK